MKPLALFFVLVLALPACQDSGNNTPTILASEPGKRVASRTVVASAKARKSYLDSGGKPYYLDTIDKNESYVVLGDSNERLSAENVRVMLKFKPYITFNDVPARLESLTARAAIRYSSHKWARQYRTVITESYKEKGLNFGGHYCFAYWGCGSNCQISVLIDSRTGIVYEGPDSGNGYIFRKDSRLLIADPPDSAGFYSRNNRGEPRVYVWNETQKTFEQRQ
jgi:hypothetical protein